MKTIRILALHLAYGGVEKAIISMANLFAEKYKVEILSVYKMPGSPAFALDERVSVRYLLDETPNRAEWKDALARKNAADFIRESIKSVRVLAGKKLAVINAIRSIHDGILITTRHEDNIVASLYGDKNILKIAQLHHDHNFEARYVRGFKKKYNNIDVFALLAPKLTDEVRQMMAENRHTRLVSIPNFLEHYPENVDVESKEKIMLAVGRLEAVKGFDRLVRMFVRIHDKAPDWKLKIVGEGAERVNLEKLIDNYKAQDYIQLTGKLSGAEVEKEMLRASIYAMTSLSEGFPFVIMEAQSCALPCVAFDVRVGPGVLLEDEKTGFLVPDGDEDTYVERTLLLMADNDLRKTMGEEALNHSHLYSRDKISEMWYSVLEENNG